MKIVLRFPSTLHSAHVSVRLGFAVGLRPDLRRVRITHYVIKQVLYIELQQNHIFLSSLST
jgi:hypothetical protein